MRDRAHIERERRRWHLALQAAVADLTKEDPEFLPFLGSIAWGRYEGEPSPDESKDRVAEGLGFLQGVRYALLHVARATQREAAAKILTNIHAYMPPPTTT